jgi:hypothetical protein
MESAALGGSAALLSSLWSLDSLAQLTPANAAILRGNAEKELDALKASDPTTHGMITDAVAHSKYVFTCAAAKQGTGSGTEFADACRTFVAKRKPKTQAAYEKGAKLLLATDTSKKAQFGRYAAIAPVDFLAMTHARAAAASTVPARGTLGLHTLQSLELSSAGALDLPEGPTEVEKEKAKSAAEKAKDLEAGKVYTTLQFRIHEVKCIRETGDQGWSNDEIALGGTVIGATGDRARIKQFSVKAEMNQDKGMNTKTWNAGGGKLLHEFPIHRPSQQALDEFKASDTGKKLIAKGHKLPDKPVCVYMVHLAMAELDSGGFGDFLEKLWDHVKTFVVGAITDAVGSLIGGTALSFIPGLGTVIGAAIGALISWLVGLFHNEDDIVGHVTRGIQLKSQTKSYYEAKGLVGGDSKLPAKLMVYNDSGDYHVSAFWHLHHP